RGLIPASRKFFCPSSPAPRSDAARGTGERRSGMLWAAPWRSREQCMFVVGGESLIDLVPVSAAPGAEREALPGGSPFNCAIALGKVGARTGLLWPITGEEYGALLLAPLGGAGVVVLLRVRVAAPTTKAIVSFDEKMQASYVFE